MSRIGNKPIPIPANVEITFLNHTVTVKGPKGSLSFETSPSITVEKAEEDGVAVLRCRAQDPEVKLQRSLWGTTRALLQNMVKGVTDGFSKSLEVVGVGYRANLQGNKVVFDVGYSHAVEFPLPVGIAASVEKNVLTLQGADRQLVGETAARMRRIRKPEPYKGTGIKYTDETIRRKAGKAGKAGAA